MTTTEGIVEIPSAEGRGIRKFSRVVMRAGMEAEGRNVSPNDHEGQFSIPLAGLLYHYKGVENSSPVVYYTE